MILWRVDRRADLGPVGDQGFRPTCLAWALSTAHHHDAALPQFPSVEYLHWASGNHPPGRGRIRSASLALRSDGQPPESQWPYLDAVDEADPTYAPPSDVTGPLDRADVRLCPVTVDSLAQELVNGSCPLLGLRVTDAFLRASGGLVTEDGPGTDGHAVVVVGVADYTGPHDLSGVQAGTRLVCVRNSWGSSWGVGGDALMTEEAFELVAAAVLVVEPSPT